MTIVAHSQPNRARWLKRIGRKVFLLLLFVILVNGTFSSASSAPQEPSVHIHGQVRDTSDTPRQAFVTISTYQGPDLTQGPTTPDGFYAFDVPAQDHYVVTAFPVQRATIGAVEAPVGFVDRWERINRTIETDLIQDVIVTPGGSILLDAYDPQGNPMFMDNFPEQAFFITYPLGSMPVTEPIQSQNHSRSLLGGWETVSGTLRNPAVLMAPSDGTGPFIVWGLWTVPEAGTIMLDMDNGGQGFSAAAGEAKTINLAYELARTQYRKAKAKFDQKSVSGYTFSAKISQWLGDALAALNVAQAHLGAGDGAATAVSAYQALTPAIRAKEEIALEVAQQDIQKRRLPVTVRVVGVDQQPIDGVQMDYQETNHDFLISGAWGGAAVPLGDTPETRVYVGNANLYAGIANQIGFEVLNNPPWSVWGGIQREWPTVPYRFDDEVVIHKMASLGFRPTGGNLVWFNTWQPGNLPAFVEGMSYPQVKAAALDFVTTTVSHFAGKIHLYNLMNEPNTANDLNFTPVQMLDLTQAVLAAGKTADPQAIMAVILSAPGLGQFGRAPGDESTADFSSYHYLHQMLAAGIHPDAVGLQFYAGATLPAFDLGTASDLLDVYGQEFELPFYIEEMEYPTHEDYPGLVNKSDVWGWRQGHTDQAQADWAVGMYTLAFSKPYLLGANWSMSSDIPGDLIENGRAGDGYLHTDGLTPRPMATALGNLFHSWMISGTAQTSSDGQVGFSGFAGDYQLLLTGANGAVHQETIHVKEGQTNAFTIVFDPDQTRIDNAQDSQAALDKVQQTLSWAGNLGKTSGVIEAKSWYTQAQSAKSAGQYWDSASFSKQACDALEIQVDGQAGDWTGVSPLFTQSNAQGQAKNSQLRHFYATLDDASLVMQFEFNTPSPQRDFLFQLDTGADGVEDFSVTASRQSGTTLFYSNEYVGHPDQIFMHIIPSIDVIYGSVVEIRIPLEDLGNPQRVGVGLYLEDQGGGTLSGLIPSLGVVTAPSWRIRLPLVIKN
jgi:hypothetical protein